MPLPIHSDFISSPNNTFYGKIKVWILHFIQLSSSVYLNLEEFLSPSLCFKTSLKSTGQLLWSFLQFGFI